MAPKIGSKSDLSYHDFMVLSALSLRRDHRGRLFEIGRSLGWEKSRLSHHVGKMCERGLISRSACTGDKRGTIIEASELGMAEMYKERAGHEEMIRSVFASRLNAEQIRVLGEVGDIFCEEYIQDVIEAKESPL